MLKNDLNLVNSMNYSDLQAPLKEQLTQFGLNPENWNLVSGLRRKEFSITLPIQLSHKEDEDLQFMGISKISFSQSKVRKIEWLNMSLCENS